ncbi:35794_t:CDS:2 [Gigaspora margarita]|uniref:35794_t:CDS:1 n=1 Tax=Gigaspora margarita TaxID=4874 RepID=A0ABN7VYU7_GIGMA|nr:35794_t:CDS:2 [Gigaspora margarita]
MFHNARNKISTSNNDELCNNELYNDELYNDELYNITNPYHERVQNPKNIYYERVRIMNSEKLLTFRNWNYKDNRFDELYTNNHTEYDVISDILYPNEYNMNIKNNQYYELQHFGQPKATKSKNPKKETPTKCIGYTWQINLLCPKKDNPFKTIYIAKLVNKHKNHNLDQAHYNFQKNIAFTKEITENTNDASKLYEELLNKKEVDPQWYVQQIKKAMNRTALQAIFTNTDSALVATIRDEFPTTNAFNCMFYIAQNIPLNLKNLFRDKYEKFYNNENVVNYLQRLYANKELWAKVFVLKLFIAGMSSISQVEKLAEKLTACILEEDKKTKYALFCASVSKAVLVATANTIFSNVCKMIRKYLTIEILKIQEDQIKQSLQYYVIIVAQNESQRYLTVNINNKICV